MNKIKEIWGNKWFKFAFYAVIYILLFVVWTGNPWMLLGLVLIYDIYVSKFLYRLFWRRHKETKKRSKPYRIVMEWVEAIVFAVVVVTFIKLFVFGMYVIPTPSMEKSLLVGDYLYVSKLAYGPAVPNTPVSFPLVHNTMPLSETKKSYSECIKWPYHRLKGFGKVKSGDVVVFNFPAGDTVVLENQAETYYSILRDYQEYYGEAEGRRRLYAERTVMYRPVDKRENYVKRCVGLPGDSIQSIGAKLLVNGEPFREIDGMQYRYYIQTNGTPISTSAIESMGLARHDWMQDGNSYIMLLTAENYERVKNMGNVAKMIEYPHHDIDPAMFPHDERYPWNQDNFGPLWIPAKGVTVPLTPDNLPLYRTIIENYELHKLEVKDDRIYIDGAAADSYTFAMDYFFMMGDSRDNSLDSRFWGFVPEDHIVGRASFIWMSTDQEKGSFPFNIRWSRLFRKVR